MAAAACSEFAEFTQDSLVAHGFQPNVTDRCQPDPVTQRSFDLSAYREARSVQHDLGVDRLGDMDRAEQVTKQAEITQGG